MTGYELKRSDEIVRDMQVAQIAGLKRRTLYMTLCIFGLLICSGLSLLITQSHRERLGFQMNTIADNHDRINAQRFRIDVLENRLNALKARMDAEEAL